MDNTNEIADRMRYLTSIINKDKEKRLQEFRQNVDDVMRAKALKELGVVESPVQEPSRKEIQAFIDCGKRMGVRFTP
jgi:hypothetical protein